MVKMWNKHFGVVFDFMPESHPTVPNLVLNAKIISSKVPRFKIKTLSFQNVSGNISCCGFPDMHNTGEAKMCREIFAAAASDMDNSGEANLPRGEVYTPREEVEESTLHDVLILPTGKPFVISR